MQITNRVFIKYFLIVTFFFQSSLVFSVSMDEPAKKITSSLNKKQRRMAVVGFETNNNKQMNNLAELLAESLTTSLVQIKSVDVVERRLLKKVLNEQGLEMSGVVDSPGKLGKLLKVNTLVLGSLLPSKPGFAELNVRAVDVNSGKIYSAFSLKLTLNKNQNDVASYEYLEALQNGAALIQIAILLDTSNSMDGLILQAKTQLWKIVNQLASSKKRNRSATIEIALYEYGNDSLNVAQGYVRQVLGFTTNMDLVSKELFGLTTNGGSEYAGFVLKESIKKLKWSKSKEAYKSIFIAGNEGFDQGPVPYKEVVRNSVTENIFVNTIYCGAPSEVNALSWKDAAKLSGGMFLNIDQNRERRVVHTPYDKKIEKLGNELNATYIPYGEGSHKAKKEQEVQDTNAASQPSSGANIERSMFKASRQYSRASSWDIISLIENGQLKIKDIDKTKLPAKLKKLSNKKLKKFINKQIKLRAKIRADIASTGKKRKSFIRKKEREEGEANSESLDMKMEKALHKQAVEKDFSFEK